MVIGLGHKINTPKNITFLQKIPNKNKDLKKKKEEKSTQLKQRLIRLQGNCHYIHQL